MLYTYEEELRKSFDETDSQFLNRLVSSKKDYKLTWKDIQNIANSELNLNYSESWYRKNIKLLTDVSSENSEEDNSNDALRKVMMKRAELADLVASNSAYIRKLSREQTIKDIAHDYAQTMAKAKPLLQLKPCSNEYSGKEGILLISDWHYGLVCDNAWNKFDPIICKARVSKLLSETINLIEQHRIEKLTVLDLSDLIAGRIHTQIRIESRFDVITQTMDVAEILAEFLQELSIHCPIDFYSSLDNHSRLEPNKKESMDLESLTRIIPWYLIERMSLNGRINVCGNEFGEDIITCNVLGHDIIAVHGDKDSPLNALEKLSLFTRKQYSMVCMAHRHHMFLEEQFESMVVSNGCLVGVDTHSHNMRLRSKPSQTFIVVTKNNVTHSINRIILD